MAQIILRDVSVQIPIYQARGRSLKAAITRHAVGATIGRLPNSDDVVVVNALKNISLTLNSGDCVGIIGHNGAGKTTLLRVFADIYSPTGGRVEISGEVSSLTSISMGIDPEATGHENIITRAILLGMNYRQARALAPEIEVFTQLGGYLDLPVRTYSAGMLLRLAFAVATTIEPDILIMDEMIDAGDASFMEQARARIGTLIKKASIFVIASHNEDALQRSCNRAIWLDHGEIRQFGPLDETLAAYKEACRQTAVPA
jgi:ABC-type polysaccharide/polyol phosphate transport system ATPase subunit